MEASRLYAAETLEKQADAGEIAPSALPVPTRETDATALIDARRSLGLYSTWGDIMTGDSHGVVVIPRRDAELVLAKSCAIAQAEEKKIAEIESGQIIPGCSKKCCKQKGCEILNEAWEK
jgi:hypothetical protein